MYTYIVLAIITGFFQEQKYHSYSVYWKTKKYISSYVARPQSIMLKNLPKMLLGISQKIPLLCSDSFLLCSIMLIVVNV